MTLEIVRLAMVTELQDNWSATSIMWDNSPQQLDPPYIAMRMDDAGTLSRVGSVKQYFGEVAIHIIVSENSGVVVARQHADSLIAQLNNKRFNGVWFGPARPIRVGVIEGVYQYNVYFPYRYEG